jgi:hypothetical protein
MGQNYRGGPAVSLRDELNNRNCLKTCGEPHEVDKGCEFYPEYCGEVLDKTDDEISLISANISSICNPLPCDGCLGGCMTCFEHHMDGAIKVVHCPRLNIWEARESMRNEMKEALNGR